MLEPENWLYFWRTFRPSSSLDFVTPKDKDEKVDLINQTKDMISELKFCSKRQVGQYKEDCLKISWIDRDVFFEFDLPSPPPPKKKLWK